MTKKQ